MRLIKPIAISLSPNTEKDDVILALKILLQPWRWLMGKELKEVENWFKSYFGVEQAVSFNSGRSALYALLKSFGIGKDDEVLVQAFTCVAIPNSVLWTGAKPVYVDIKKETYNMEPIDLEKKITQKAKAVIIQNTFGILANIEKIKKITQKHGLLLIEDGAHSLGGKYDGGEKVGSVGDAAFFSFGRDKIISSVFGGTAIISSRLNPEPETSSRYGVGAQGSRLRKFQNELKFPSRWWILRQLLHPVLFNLFILPFYNFFKLGKILLIVLQKLKVLSIPVYKEERQGRRPEIFPQKLPNALAILALNQLKKLEKFNEKRKQSARLYFRNLSNSNCFSKKSIYLRYPVLLNNAQEVYEKAKKKGILLGRWYSHVIDPEGVDSEKLGYQKGSCPVAEDTANKILNLPTYPKMREKDVHEVVKLLDDLPAEEAGRLKNSPV